MLCMYCIIVGETLIEKVKLRKLGSVKNVGLKKYGKYKMDGSENE